MRLVIALLILFVTVVSASFFANHLLKASTVGLLEQIEEISRDMDNKHWDNASQKTIKLQKDWEERAGWWPALLDHQEIDNIEFAMGRAREYVAEKNTPLARGQMAELRLMIKHIPEKEAVSLKNVF